MTFFLGCRHKQTEQIEAFTHNHVPNRSRPRGGLFSAPQSSSCLQGCSYKQCVLLPTAARCDNRCEPCGFMGLVFVKVKSQSHSKTTESYCERTFFFNYINGLVHNSMIRTLGLTLTASAQNPENILKIKIPHKGKTLNVTLVLQLN